MKASKIKSNIIGSLFAFIFMAASFTAMAHTADTTETKKATKKKVMLTKEEKAFFQEIEDYYQETFVQTTVETKRATPQK